MNTERRLLISDATLKNGAGFTFREKLDTVRQIGRLGVDALELGTLPEGDKSAALLCRTAGALLDSCVLSLEVSDTAGADEAAAALSSAARPRLAVSLPLSTVQCEYIYHKKPSAMPQTVSALVSYARGLCRDVEFRALDAARAEDEVLASAVRAAVEAGAGTVTVCDTAGEILPDETAALIGRVRAAAGEGVTVGAECSDRLGLGVACALAAAAAGAGKICCAISKGAVPLTLFCDAVAARGAELGISCGVDRTVLGHTAGRILESAGRTGASAGSPFENGAGGLSGSAAVSADAGIGEVSEAVRKIGYELSEEDTVSVYEAFRRLAEKSGKEAFSDRELDAIVASGTAKVPATYKLVSYVINSGNTIASTAHISLERDGKKLTGFCVGDGPIDASFLAIEQIIGHHYELDDFQIQAVTEGREAMGDALVRLRSEGRLYSGKGLSTDIIGASIRAYVSALNKIAFEERSGG